MRITVHLSTFDRLNPCAYAILWLDRERRQWSRESHFGVNLPAWGVLRTEPHATSVCAQGGEVPIFELDGLELDGDVGPFEGETGGAQWIGSRRSSPGHWYVQCVDEETAPPEHGIFAGDDADAASPA
ncbi:DUF3564 family protein [Trinickia caryophylli]|uniref:DUF3564 domain-containing protein n=1 Tax=Trinickia caryophylli TaxID=28094 RepID=A0A1X7H558_TRICW|nr:DUF3564 family protein [Trinickia caryophylli]PMS09640.1 DUF3564 domain-containing protein [Trinickia caryophylli]TRX17259.1 DUF3564 family protein [Trinickia caryophylli]WQE12004.1 DUF3564 family protein [Trinickia caryophylli]SMF79752.1 Protein of unknown function [Trinickia caryophylli]GLU35603.1 hypothetical protein Busp01_54450 [Trinickia caryophylli]